MESGAPGAKPTPGGPRLLRLLDRLTQQRRRDTGTSASSPKDQSQAELFEALEERVTHLERLLEGLQDSVDRVAVRQEREMDDLRRRTEPAQIARALERYSRQHGL
jgi:hypothetical protein